MTSLTTSMQQRLALYPAHWNLCDRKKCFRFRWSYLCQKQHFSPAEVKLFSVVRTKNVSLSFRKSTIPDMYFITNFINLLYSTSTTGEKYLKVDLAFNFPLNIASQRGGMVWGGVLILHDRRHYSFGSA